MMRFILRFILLAATIFILSKYLNGFSITSTNPIQTTAIIGIILTVIYVFIKPLINILTIPINILTLGLFSFALNVVILFVVASYVNGFSIQTFRAGIIASIIISIVNSFIGVRN